MHRATEINLAVQAGAASAASGDVDRPEAKMPGASPTPGPPSVALDLSALTVAKGASQLGTTAGTDSHTPSSSQTEAADNTFRIVRGMQTMLSHRGGAMHMRLDPPELGTMRVQMNVSNGVVSATFEVETVQAQQLLNQSLTTLRQSLELQGLQVDRLHVHTTHQSQVQTESNMQHDRSSDDERQRGSNDAGKGESRGRREHQHAGPHRGASFASFRMDANLEEQESLTQRVLI